MKKVLTIAGSDSSGGAGIQADLKTILAHKVYGMSVITALTAQNTEGVDAIMEATPEFVGQQMDCIFKDIVPDAVKIGMVSNIKIIEAIVDKLEEYQAKNIVVDPVMVATSGAKLLNDEAVNAVRNKLIPEAKIITPNLLEAEVLSETKILSKNDMITAAKKISENISGSVLIKAGHAKNNADDLLYINGNPVWIEGKRIDNRNTHGTGCTLSSAIACGLALGYDVETSTRNAKKYINGALKAQLNLGQGSGPLDHGWNINLK